LKLQCKLYKEFFTDETPMIFKRNWKLPGHESFRTTWSAGYYLYFLQSLGIKFPGSEAVFVPLDKRYEEARALSREAGAGEGKENVGLVLVTLKDVIKQIQEVAVKVGKKITPMLQKIAKDFGGEMKGLDFKIKGEGSLYRKLVAEVMELMTAHENEPSYTPSLEECVQGIKDSLRYTIIFPPDKYADGVKEVEKIMLQEPGDGTKATANAIKFKNFWYADDNVTTYMGINSQVRINEIPDVQLSHNYWYELQFHTAGSFFLKDEASHVFYEAFRDPKHDKGTIPPKHQTSSGQPDYSDATSTVYEGDEFNARLYLEMLKLWNINGKNDDDKVVEGKDMTWKDVKNFKPADLSICEYDGGTFKGDLQKGGSAWFHLPKASKRFHSILKEKKLI